jgi:hypothetical protein
MSLFHAVVFVDHHAAQILQFDRDQALEHKLHEHLQLTRQHASGVRSEHEFFGAVCDALEGITQVLVTGGHQGLADFRHFVEKHRPLSAKHIVGYEVVGHPSENELVVIARKYFVQYNLMQGIPVPT